MQFYSLNKNIFISQYENKLILLDFLTDNKIFGDENAYIFLSELDYVPREINEISKSIQHHFKDSSFPVVLQDATEFFNSFVELGLISKGETYLACKNNSDLPLRNFANTGDFSCEIDEGKVNELIELPFSKPVLQNILIEITRKCNERCIHCYIPHEEKNIEIDAISFYKLIDEIKDFGSVVSIIITGGEATSHPKIKDFLRYVKKKKLALTLITNGTLIDDEIVDILSDGCLSKVQISLFSLDRSINDRITCLPGSLDKVLENIEKLRNVNIPVGIASQVLNENKESIPDLCDFCKNENLDFRLDFNIIGKENGMDDNLSCRLHDMIFYKDIFKTREEYDPSFKDTYLKALQKKPLGPNTHLCNVGNASLVIDPKLDIFPCTGLRYKVGSLKESKLGSIWENSVELKKLRKIVLKDFKKCLGCAKRNICHICIAQAYNESNRNIDVLNMPQYVCDFVDILHEYLQEK